MTAPIVEHHSRTSLDPAALRMVMEVTPDSVSHLVTTVRRDWDNPPKGQLWERLAEVTFDAGPRLGQEIREGVYFERLAEAYRETIRLARVRRRAGWQR